MKKLFTTLFIVLCMQTTIFAESQQYNPNRPEWKDFCPFGMENVDSYNMQKSIVGTDKHWQIKEYNYWVDRKNDFNRDIKVCNELVNNSENQNKCYQKLVDRQNRLNQTDVTPMQVWQNKKVQWQQAANVMQQQSMQQEQLNLQRKQLMIQQSQNMPKWSDVAPRQYDININHNIKYNNGFQFR